MPVRVDHSTRSNRSLCRYESIIGLDLLTDHYAAISSPVPPNFTFIEATCHPCRAKPILGPLSKNNTGMAALHAGMPITMKTDKLPRQRITYRGLSTRPDTELNTLALRGTDKLPR